MEQDFNRGLYPVCTVQCSGMYGTVQRYVRYSAAVCTVQCGSMYGTVYSAAGMSAPPQRPRLADTCN